MNLFKDLAETGVTLCLSHYHDYGVDHRQGWTLSINGCMVVSNHQFTRNPEELIYRTILQLASERAKEMIARPTP